MLRAMISREVCNEHADKVFRVESPGYVERIIPWLNEQCTVIGSSPRRRRMPSAGLIEILLL